MIVKSKLPLPLGITSGKEQITSQSPSSRLAKYYVFQPDPRKRLEDLVLMVAPPVLNTAENINSTHRQ